jgi:hypothetical protein
MLLHIASKWLELSAYDGWTQALLSSDDLEETRTHQRPLLDS